MNRINIGEKIRSKRIDKSLSINELANQINDSVENIEKYEQNIIEPTLDKKILLCSVLDLRLDELSYNINTTRSESYNIKDEEMNEEKIETVEEEIEEEIIETPFATSKTTYTEEVFDAVFKKDYTRYCVQILISTIGYLLITLYTVLLKVNLFTYIGIAITGYSFVKFVVILSNYKKNKHKWLEQYGNIVKRYDYYKDYILITSDSDNQADVRFEYSTIVRVIEKTNYILCMVLAPAKTILIIDKSSLDDESLVKVRATLKETCMDYIEKSPERKEQQALTKTEKTVKILNIITLVLAISSIIIVNLLNRIFHFDNTLEMNLIIYSISIVLPLSSIIMGIISNKKFKIKSLKNIIVGIVMGALCLLFVGLSFVNHYVLKMNNNDQLKEQIEEVSTTKLPDYYYTLYYSNKLENITINENEYKVKSYQVWSFVKNSEISTFEKELVNISNWNNYSDYKDSLILNENASSFLKSLGYDTSKEASYFLLINNDIKDAVLSIEDGNYTYMAYYAETNLLLVIDLEIIK